MTFNKNQHFVPRTHLKPFSLKGEGKAINLFNIDRNEFFFDAPLKNQCSKDYFYGKDEKLESALQFMERGYGKCAHELQNQNTPISDLQSIIIKRFIYLQYIRTEAAARQFAEITFAITSVKGSDIELPSLKEAMKKGVISALMHYANNIDLVDDLKLRIVKNLSTTSFVTSDDPAVIANRWNQNYPHAKYKGFGIASAGTILFMPLSPSLLAILFDGDVYTTESSEGWIHSTKIQDIEACNEQQILNCDTNIYFHNANERYFVKSAAIELRPKSKFEVYFAAPDRTTETHSIYTVTDDPDFRDHEEILFHAKSVRPVPPRWPTFIKFRHKRSVYTNGTGAGFCRRMTVRRRSSSGPPWRKIHG